MPDKSTARLADPAGYHSHSMRDGDKSDTKPSVYFRQPSRWNLVTFSYLVSPTLKELTVSTQVIPTLSRPMATATLIFSWICRIVAAIILLQTLFFKFTAAPESVYIFTKLGAFIHNYIPFASIGAVEVSGRIGSGIMELIAAVLLLTPRFVWAGAILAIAATGGAIASHLTFLGIEVQGDKGLLFLLAIAVFVASAIALLLHSRQVPIFGKRV
jgi:putative oxidoreductase